MVRERLQAAADSLTNASETSEGEAAERLEDLADQLETLSTRDRAPDHGRLARIQNALNDIETQVDEDARADIDEADDAINGFRETIEGV